MNDYSKLPLEMAIKEALYEFGATDRLTNAVQTDRIADFLVDRGFPKKRGRTYQGSEHVTEVAVDIAALAKTNRLRGWFHFVGGKTRDPWNNWNWSIPPDELAERPCQPAPPRAEHVRSAAIAEASEAPPPPPPAPPSAAAQPVERVKDRLVRDLGAASIEEMGRPELVAFIESLGGVAKAFPQHKTERLREMARDLNPRTTSAAQVMAALPKVHMS